MVGVRCRMWHFVTTTPSLCSLPQLYLMMMTQMLPPLSHSYTAYHQQSRTLTNACSFRYVKKAVDGRGAEDAEGCGVACGGGIAPSSENFYFFLNFKMVHSGANSKVLFAIKCRERYVIMVFLATDNLTVIQITRNSSGDEIANVNFLRRHRTRTTAHNKVHFAYGKHTCL